MKLLSALIGVILIYQLQKYLFGRFWNKNLEITMNFSDNKAVEGDRLILYETIINKKLLPLPLIKIKFMTSRYLDFLDSNLNEVTDHYYRNDLLSVMMYQKLTREIPFLCSHRGYYSIHMPYLVCCDIFLSTEYIDSIDIDLYLYIYPKPVEDYRFQIPFQKMLGTVLSKRCINEDPFEFRSIREYQTHDTLKAINWKASAKTGSLMVNVFDYTASQQIKIFLNMESETIWIHDDLREESIRIAATFAVYFIEQGIPTSIITNARDIITLENSNVPAGSGINHIQTVNETLARIDTSLEVSPFVASYEQELLQTSQNDYIILISSYQKEDIQQILSTLQNHKIDFSWIVPLSKEVRLTVNNELLSQVLPWEI